MNITLCDIEYNEDIPQYKFEDKNEAYDFIIDWLETKDFDKSVFVCFNNWRNLPIEELRNEQVSLLISHSWDDITDMVEYYTTENFCKTVELDFAIFEFESYKEALEYCIDLKESF